MSVKVQQLSGIAGEGFLPKMTYAVEHEAVDQGRKKKFIFNVPLSKEIINGVTCGMKRRDVTVQRAMDSFETQNCYQCMKLLWLIRQACPYGVDSLVYRFLIVPEFIRICPRGRKYDNAMKGDSMLMFSTRICPGYNHPIFVPDYSEKFWFFMNLFPLEDPMFCNNSYLLKTVRMLKMKSIVQYVDHMDMCSTCRFNVEMSFASGLPRKVRECDCITSLLMAREKVSSRSEVHTKYVIVRTRGKLDILDPTLGYQTYAVVEGRLTISVCLVDDYIQGGGEKNEVVKEPFSGPFRVHSAYPFVAVEVLEFFRCLDGVSVFEYPFVLQYVRKTMTHRWSTFVSAMDFRHNGHVPFPFRPFADRPVVKHPSNFSWYLFVLNEFIAMLNEVVKGMKYVQYSWLEPVIRAIGDINAKLIDCPDNILGCRIVTDRRGFSLLPTRSEQFEPEYFALDAEVAEETRGMYCPDQLDEFLDAVMKQIVDYSFEALRTWEYGLEFALHGYSIETSGYQVFSRGMIIADPVQRLRVQNAETLSMWRKGIRRTDTWLCNELRFVWQPVRAAKSSYYWGLVFGFNGYYN